MDPPPDLAAHGSERERWNEKHRRAQVGGSAPSDWLVEHRPLLAAQPKGRALDLACGRGRHALLLAELGFEVDALDVSDVAVEAARRSARERGARVNVGRVDLRDAPFPTPPYEVVVSTYYLERSLFARMREALAPGGLLVFETFTRDHVEVLGREMPERALLGHNELLRAFADLRVLRYREANVGTGRTRAVASLVARAPEASVRSRGGARGETLG